MDMDMDMDMDMATRSSHLGCRDAKRRNLVPCH